MRTLGLYSCHCRCRANGWIRAAGQDLLADGRSVRARSPRSFCSILILFSIVSWGIILYKLWAFSRAERQSAAFLDVFRRSSKFSEVQAVCKTSATARSSASSRPATPS